MAMSPQDSPLFDTDDSDNDHIIDSKPCKEDIFQLSAREALDLLSEYLQRLLQGTPTHPLTPPTSPPQTPDAVLELTSSPGLESVSSASQDSGSAQGILDDAIVSPPEPDSDSAVQHHALARKFFSKHPPPIPIDDYLERLHKFCPLSPAVYLAVTFYINRMILEHLVTVSPLNIHRLLLAGLRVASKALEDRSYPNSRFAKVGGISLKELSRLEVSFLFLTSFELKVDEKLLSRQLLLLNQKEY